MTRRTAAQTILAVIWGAMDNQTDPQTTTGRLTLPDWTKRSLFVSLHWKEIIIERNGERVTLDQDELFRALKGASAPEKGSEE